MSYTLYIYKADKRTNTGERLYSTTVWPGLDAKLQNYNGCTL